METRDRVRETHKLQRSIRLFIMEKKINNNNYHIDVWFGWPAEPKRDVLYLHSASPSLASPSSLMMSRHFIWQRPITGLGTSSTSNETACGVRCVVVWICCLCRPDFPASPAHSLFCHYFLSVGSWNDSTLRASVSFAKTQKKKVDLIVRQIFWNWKKNQKANHCSHGLTDM